MPRRRTQLAVHNKPAKRGSPKEAVAAKRALLVLGMHRSGTSALTRILNLLGAALPADLMAPVENENPLGFWESVQLMEIHERILASAGLTWDDPVRFPRRWLDSPAAISFRRELLDFLSSHFASSPLFAIKDPRMCRFAALWLRALEDFGAEPLAVLLIRNPVEIAKSLKQRNGFFASHSYLLWLHHVLESERDTRAIRRCFVSYENLLTDWERSVTDLTDSFRLEWPRSISSAASEAEAFLRMDLRHHVSDFGDLSSRPTVGKWVVRVYENLLTLVDGDTPKARARLDRITRELGRADQVFSPILTTRKMAHEREAQAGRRLETKLAEEQTKRERLAAELAQTDNALNEQTSRVQELTRSLEARDTEVDQLRAQAEAVRQNLAEHTERLKQLESELTRWKGEAGRLITELQDTERALARRTSELEVQKNLVEGHLIHLRQLDEEVETSKRVILEHGQQLERQFEELQGVRKREEQSSAQMQRLFREKRFLQRGTTRMAKQLRSTRAESRSRKQQLRQLKKQSREFTVALKQREGQLTSVEHLAATSAEDARNALAQLRQKQADLRELKAEVGRLDAQVQELHSTKRPSKVGLINRSAHIVAAFRNRSKRRRRKGELEEMTFLANSQLFDARYYLEQNNEVSQTGVDPLKHYVHYGVLEGRDPNPLFDTRFYLRQHPGLDIRSVNPLRHYIEKGAHEGSDPHRLFDTSYYLAENPDVAASGINPLWHYIHYGGREGRDPNPLFDSSYYVKANPPVAAADLNPLIHYVQYGAREGRKPNPLFDTKGYRYEKVGGSTPLEQFIASVDYPEFIANLQGQALSRTAKHSLVSRRVRPVLVQELLGESRDHQDPERPQTSPLSICREIYRNRLGSEEAKRYCTQRSTQTLEAFLETDETLDFETFGEPEVSVILVLFNRAELTFLCLRSLLAHSNMPMELIVVDNNSTDHTASLLARLRGARVVSNTRNVGFVHAANQASSHATGKYLLLLNNDAIPAPYTLSHAAQTLKADPSVAAVGARIVLLDGTLQEAGSIIWNDGSCLGYGRGDRPDSSTYLFRRDVHYCSAAFLLVQRLIFERLGRFDETFRPGYYEESDFCMRVRQAGYRIVYEPDAVVFHYEFASSLSSRDAVRLQKKHRLLFFDKHRELLRQHLPAKAPNILKARHAGNYRGRILFLDDRVPQRALGSGFPRALEIVRTVNALGYLVTLYPMTEPVVDAHTMYSDLPREVEVIEKAGNANLPKFLLQYRRYFDHVFVSRPHNMRTLREALLKKPGLLPGTQIIYDAEALFAVRDATKAALNGVRPNATDLERLLEPEVALARTASTVVAVSEREANIFAQHGLCNIHTLGHCIKPRLQEKPFELRRDILFVGGMHDDDTPNADSIMWFLQRVWPLIRSRRPDMRLHIVGSRVSPMIWAMGTDEVRVHGFVADTCSLYGQCRLFIAPTRYAAGIPYKVHEAAAYGLPTVATTLIAEQLGWRHNEELLSADSPPDFSDCCLRLHSDPQLWRRIRSNAVKRIRSDCSPDAFQSAIQAVLGVTPQEGQRYGQARNTLQRVDTPAS